MSYEENRISDQKAMATNANSYNYKDQKALRIFIRGGLRRP